MNRAGWQLPPRPPRALNPRAVGDRALNELRDAVYAVYLQYDESADAIVCDPDLAACFVARVTDTPGLSRDYLPREVMRCLLNMRKRGALPLKPRAVCE